MSQHHQITFSKIYINFLTNAANQLSNKYKFALVKYHFENVFSKLMLNTFARRTVTSFMN